MVVDDGERYPPDHARGGGDRCGSALMLGFETRLKSCVELDRANLEIDLVLANDRPPRAMDELGKGWGIPVSPSPISEIKRSDSLTEGGSNP